MATALENVGTAYYNVEKYDKAEKYYRQALVMKREIYGKGVLHPELVVT